MTHIHVNGPGNAFLSEEALRRIAAERGWILSEVGQQPEVRLFTVSGDEWRPKGR